MVEAERGEEVGAGAWAWAWARVESEWVDPGCMEPANGQPDVEARAVRKVGGREGAGWVPFGKDMSGVK